MGRVAWKMAIGWLGKSVMVAGKLVTVARKLRRAALMIGRWLA